MLYLVFVAAAVFCIKVDELASTPLAGIFLIGGFIVTCIYEACKKDEHYPSSYDYIKRATKQNIDEENEYGIIDSHDKEK